MSKRLAKSSLSNSPLGLSSTMSSMRAIVSPEFRLPIVSPGAPNAGTMIANKINNVFSMMAGGKYALFKDLLNFYTSHTEVRHFSLLLLKANQLKCHQVMMYRHAEEKCRLLSQLYFSMKLVNYSAVCTFDISVFETKKSIKRPFKSSTVTISSPSSFHFFLMPLKQPLPSWSSSMEQSFPKDQGEPDSSVDADNTIAIEQARNAITKTAFAPSVMITN